jgi:hypothetical protein
MSKAAPSYDTTLTLTPSLPQNPVDPLTHLPESFAIGGAQVPPLVTVPELVQHLTFLACLHRLQQDVREYRTRGVNPLSGDIKWAAFCVRAAHRFEAWATSPDVIRQAELVKKNRARYLPQAMNNVDIDIFMVWHTYLLNPAAYDEDMDREGLQGSLRALRMFGAFPLELIVSQLMFITYCRSLASTRKRSFFNTPMRHRHTRRIPRD